MVQCKGIITAMVTPMNENQEIDFNATRQLVDKLINHGIDGLFILGTNGEGHVLSNEEKIEFAKVVISEGNSRVPIYAGVGTNSTKETIELAKKMVQVGADALSVITPYFEPIKQIELINHYTKIANSVSLPIIMYNMPKKTGVHIAPETVRELSKISNIIAIKDSSGSIDNMKAYIDITQNENFSVLSGSDSLILDLLESGGQGAVTSISNLLPEIFIDIYKNWNDGNLEIARQKQSEINLFRSILGLGTIPSILKKSLNISGTCVGPSRFPVMEPDEETVNKIKDVILEYKKK